MAVGEAEFLFSHIRQTMAVTWCLLQAAERPPAGGGGAGGAPEWRWVDAGAMEAEGLTSGQRKVFNLLQAHRAERAAPERSMGQNEGGGEEGGKKKRASAARKKSAAQGK